MRLAHHSERGVQALEAYDFRERLLTGATATVIRTTDGQLRATSDELQIAAARRGVVLGHDLDEVPDSTALYIEAVVSLQRLAESYGKMR